MDDIKNMNEKKEQRGATMVEYALMVALMAVALIAAVQALKGNVSETFSKVGNELAGT